MSERYAIKGKLGEGGQGSVYRAVDRNLERVVAVKRLVLSLSGMAPERAREELLREAALQASVQHPNVVAVYDYGVDGEGGYIVMEHVNGETLDVTARRGLPLEGFYPVARQALEGLSAAHAQSLLHRDLKPSNLMISWLAGGGSAVKLLDFGLAKFSAQPSLQTLDQHNTLKGSIYFMAPEQFEHKPLDPRTDLYALGCLFFYVLSGGRHPFDGKTVGDIMNGHLTHNLESPLPALRPEIPKALAHWVEWLMRRRREERPSDAAEAITVLAAVEKGQPFNTALAAVKAARHPAPDTPPTQPLLRAPLPPSPAPSRPLPWRIIAAGAAVLAIAGVALNHSGKAKIPPGVDPASLLAAIPPAAAPPPAAPAAPAVQSPVIQLKSSHAPTSSADWLTAASWTNGQPPRPGFDYAAAGDVMVRTAPRNPEFPGNSLRLDPGATLVVKNPGAAPVKAHLILNGGRLGNGGWPGPQNDPPHLNGTLAITAPSTVELADRCLILHSILSGSAPLEITSPSDKATLTLHSPSPGYTGHLRIKGGSVTGAGPGSFGAASFTLSPGARLDFDYDFTSPPGGFLVLEKGGKLRLDQTLTFDKVILAGEPLPPGRYTSADLLSHYRDCFSSRSTGTLIVRATAGK